MQVCIIGGKLQGIEATYLAHKAGWEVLLVDKNPSPPAKRTVRPFLSSGCDQSKRISSDLQGRSAPYSCLENQKTLNALRHLAQKHALPLAYDPLTYAISSSS